MKVTVERAIELLNNGEVVGMPTETVYGLAGSIYNEAALKSIFSTKERPFFDPLIVHVASIEMLKPLVAEWTDLHESFAQYFWPGPMTMVLPKSEAISLLITSGLSDVGIRWPRHAVAQQLIQGAGPLAAPSANKFGKTSPTQFEHVESEFGGRVAVVDGGPSEVGIESTVLSFRVLSAAEVLIQVFRPGQLSVPDFKKWAELQKIGMTVEFLESKASPGHTPEHYQPKAPLFLVSSSQTNIEQEVRNVLSLPPSPSPSQPPTQPPTQPLKCARFILNPEVVMAARQLYSQMRSAGEGVDYLLCEVPDSYDSDEWRAIRDRLSRASRKDLRH